MWTSVILAGKHDSRRHSTTSVNENVVEAETSFVSYQMLGDFISLRSGEGLTSFNKKDCANFSGEKNRYEAFRGGWLFENTLSLVLNLVLESKGL